MPRYQVTYNGISGKFQNIEIEVNPAESDKMREELVKSLRRREPLVYGRDWDYSAVTVEKTTVIDADYYSVSENKIAHFYRKKLANSMGPGRLIASVPDVVRVVEIEET